MAFAVELEEWVGAHWHRFITRHASGEFEAARVTLESMRRPLGMLFRALGGAPGVALEATPARRLLLRRTWLQRVAGTCEQAPVSWFNGDSLRLPESLAVYPQAELNRELYRWLALLAASAGPLRHWAQDNQRWARQLLDAYPALRPRYARLVAAHLRQRPSLDDCPDSFDLLVVMGGPMSVHDEAQYPWLVAEKRLIRAALDAGKKVLGICLGAQLLAQALGAAVRPGRQAEIGWWPLHRYSQALGSPLGERLPERLMAFHWHGETFDLPAGSVPLYGSAACANQGFIWNEQAIGLQCHLESTAESIEALLDACPQDLQREGAVQSAGRIRQGVAHCREVAPVLFLLLDYLAHRPAEIARRA